MVPLLEHGDHLVIESDIVTKYIAQHVFHPNNNDGDDDNNEDRNGRKNVIMRDDCLYPTENVDACHRIDHFLDSWYAVYDSYYDLLRACSLQETIIREEEFMKTLVSLENILRLSSNHQGHFLLGNDFSLAECISAPWIQRFYVTLPYFRGINFEKQIESKMDRLSKWMQEVCERPSVKETKCPEEEMIDAAKRYYVSYLSPDATGTL